jgi:hypothetical protein
MHGTIYSIVIKKTCMLRTQIFGKKLSRRTVFIIRSASAITTRVYECSVYYIVRYSAAKEKRNFEDGERKGKKTKKL